MILVTGATGNVGRYLVRELLSSSVPFRALVRDAVQARDLARKGVDCVIGSFADREELEQAVVGVETLFLLSPPGIETMISQQVAMVDAAVGAGVKRVVKQSSIGADEESGARIIKAHRRIEKHIERSGLAWTHLRSNWFMQNELAQAKTIARDGVFYAPDVASVSMIDAQDVAAAAAAVLTRGGHGGKAYVLTGPESLTYADVAKRYTAVLGTPVGWKKVTLEDARRSMLDAGLAETLATGFTEILARYRGGGVTAAVSPDVERLLGRPARLFERFVADHRDAFAAKGRAAA